MKSLSLPLTIGKKGLEQNENLKESIDQMVSLLLSSAKGSCVADPNFGFIFNNMRFENINENEGVVYNSEEHSVGDDLDLYDKKVSGTSKNLNTFAAEMSKEIGRYEKRLKDVVVNMTYIREQRRIIVTVLGTIAETNESYKYTTLMKVWN